MSWKTLVNKVDYWLGLRAARKVKEAHKADGGDIPHGSGLPLSVRWERVASFERESYKVSSIHPLEGGKVLVGCYNNVERGTSRLHVVGADGSRKEIWKGGEETIGQGWKGGGQWWLPVEKKNGDIIGVPLDGSSASAATAQGGQYSCRIVDAHVAVGNKLFQIGDTETPRAQLSKLGGIISGLVCADGEWIGSDDERGIEGESGWFISALCPELAFVGGKVLAFLRSGEVRVIEDGQLGQSIGNTIRKCRRAWTENGLCWWTTAPSDGDGKHGCWVTDGASMLKVGEFPGKAEATQAGALGSLFGSAVCIGTDGAVWVAVTDETQNGYHVWRGTPSWPKPEPEPTPDPDPEPEPSDEDFTPPERTGAGSYVGKGAFNTFLDAGRTGEHSNKLVTVEGWFKANAWTAGNSAQAAGFCFACKGLVGTRGGLMFTVRPDCLVWNATKGEITAPCTVPLGEWHHAKAESTPDSVKFWLDGKLLKAGEKTFDGPLIEDTGEPLRIGGYMCPWENATWYNQSIDGEISDWKVEMA